MPATLKATDQARSRLPPPQPGPSIPLAEPKPHVVPRMHHVADTPPPPKERVWRVTEAEFPALTAWLVPRLQETWPRLSIDGLVAVMREAMHHGRGVLLTTGRVVGLFQTERSCLEPLYATVREVWVRSNVPPGAPMPKDMQEEASLLYRHAYAWAKQHAAGEFVYNVDSDVPMSAVNPDLDRTQKLARGEKVWRLPVK